MLTTHRLIWSDLVDEKTCLALDLSQIASLDEEAPSFNRRLSIIVVYIIPLKIINIVTILSFHLVVRSSATFYQLLLEIKEDLLVKVYSVLSGGRFIRVDILR